MKKTTKALASAALGLGLAIGGNVVGAQAAEAATTTYYTANYGGTCYRVAYVNYDWWEETFQGKRDQRITLYPVTCPSTNYWPV